MKKLLLLIRVLHKCGHAQKKNQSASAHAGSMSDLIMPILGVAIAVAAFLGGQYLAQHQETMGSMESIFSTIFILGCITSFVMSIPQIINQLYMSNDLDVLVTLPVTDLEIVSAKLVSIGIWPMLLTCLLVIPCGLGFGITAGGLSAMYWVTLVLSGPIMSLSILSATAILLMLLMRCLSFIRSRNVISIISTLLIFALTIGYCLVDKDTSKIQMDKVFTALSSALSGVAQAIPVIPMCIQAMSTGSVLPLVYALAITAAAVLLMFIVARLFYFSAALGMQDANGSKKRISDAELSKSTRASSLRSSLRSREIHTILRTPAMITNGYLYSLVVPFVIIIPAAIQIVNSLKDSSNEVGQLMTLDNIRLLIDSLKIGWQGWCLGIGFLMLMMSTLSVSMSVLSRGCISREGKDYYVLKAMPIPMTTIVMVKRDVTLLFNGISGLLLPLLAVIAAAILKLVPVWTIALSLVVGTACLVFMVDMCCLFGVRKPNLNWEAEADACKNNVPGLIAFFAVLILLVGGGILLAYLESALITNIAAVAVCAVPVVLAIVFDSLLRKESALLADRF